MGNNMETTTQVTINPPNFQYIEVGIVGVTPYIQNAFSKKAQQEIYDKHVAGSTAKKGTKKEPRDFQAQFLAAYHISKDGWNGIPAAAFRNACIDACRMAGYQMTRARMSIFVVEQGRDAVTEEGLVRIYGEGEYTQMMVRNETGVCDIRVRPMWRTWNVKLGLRYDGDQFKQIDVINLLLRAGLQVGVGEGRPFSKNSNGMGYGTFTLDQEES
jgi:hypothetical protein